MSSPVNPRRRYDSTRRQAQAGHTRTAVIDAARRLFLDRGFAATTMPAVAADAGVSVQTVYKVFGSKARLAKSVFDTSMAGDDEPETMLERPALARVRDEPDPRRMFRLYGEFLAVVAPRHVPIQLVIRDAAGSDPDARAVWDELQAERLRGMSMFAQALREQGPPARRHLRPGRAGRPVDLQLGGGLRALGPPTRLDTQALRPMGRRRPHRRAPRRLISADAREGRHRGGSPHDGDHTARTCLASSLFLPGPTSNSTAWPSDRTVVPACRLETCTNTSSPFPDR